MNRIGFLRCSVALLLVGLNIVFALPLSLRWTGFTLTTFVDVAGLDVEVRESIGAKFDNAASFRLIGTARTSAWQLPEQARIAVRVRDKYGGEWILTDVGAWDHRVAATAHFSFDIPLEVDLEPGAYELVAIIYADPPFGAGLDSSVMDRPWPARYTGIWGSPWLATKESDELSLIMEP